MTEAQHRNPGEAIARRAEWVGYAASAWAFMFGLMSFYWAVGGTIGVETLGEAFTDPAVVRDPAFIAFVWATGFLKIIAGLLPLALVRQWGSFTLRRIILAAMWAGGVLLVLYAGALLVQHGLMAAGVIPIPESIGSMTALRWHLFFWDPFWLLGGILFVATAWLQRRSGFNSN